MWIVTITKQPAIYDFTKEFFPRKVKYKRDALALVLEVRTKGGDAQVEKCK